MSTKDAIRFGCPREQKDAEPPQNESYLASMERGMQSSVCGNSINDIQDRVTSMAEQSVNGVKESVGSFASASADKVRDLGKTETYENAAERVHGMVAGEDTLKMEKELNRDPERPVDSEERDLKSAEEEERRRLDGEHSRHIDSMDNEKLENYLRERHKSTAPVRRLK